MTEEAMSVMSLGKLSVFIKEITYNQQGIEIAFPHFISRNLHVG